MEDARVDIPAARMPRWQRHLRSSCFWASLAGFTIVLAHELATDVAAAVLAMPATLFALREAGRMFRLRRAHTRAARTATALRAALPAGFVVLAGYEPRDTVDRDAGIVVVGPTGVHVIEPREATGGLACHQDAWYRTAGNGVLRRIDSSPSQEARENAARVRSDISSGGFIRMPVDGAVLITGGPVTGAASASVPVLEGIPAAVAFLERLRPSTPGERVPVDRTGALVAALLGPSRLATA
ncbi:MAG: hypothetical protein NVS9B6_03090 [Candidatus Limnocylindrales bacterium]